jgi:hypothetical protein
MKLDDKTVNKLWWMCHRKFDTILPPREEKRSQKAYKKKKIELWLTYLESAGIQVRRSRECFFRFEDVVVLSGFNPRRTYKIGIPFEMAEKILVLGGLP